MAYPTLAQSKVYLDISGTDEDTLLTQMLNGAISAVERYCNRLFVAAAQTYTFPLRHPYFTDHNTVFTPFMDVAAITTLTNGDGTVITTAQYFTEPVIAPYYQICLRPSSGIVFCTDGDDTPITLAASIGYSATCPSDIFLEIMRIVALSHAAKAEGEGAIMTRSGLIIDKSEWPKQTLEVLNRRKRGSL